MTDAVVSPSQPSEPEPEASDPLVAVSRAFKAATVAVRRLRGRETQRPGELSYAQYSLLFGLADRTKLSSRELADAADLSPATVTQMLDSLETQGLVLRIRSVTDKRVVLVELTERGRHLVDERKARFEGRWREAMSEFGDHELRAAAAVLNRLAQVFKEITDDEH
jgi:DNA-binding MarR family transcriptional regulator